MTNKEFLSYLEENFDGYAVFLEKSTDFQETKKSETASKKPLERSQGAESCK